MMLYLTGASASLIKTGGNSPQSDPSKSLGGFVSSSTVPNASLNGIFDMISAYTLEKKTKETLAFALINKLPQGVSNVTLKIVTDEGNLADFKVSAVVVDKETMTMETIANRFQEPLNAQFFNASFYRAGVNVKMLSPAIKGEEIIFYPMGVTVEVKKEGQEGTWEAIEQAFEDSEEWMAKRLKADTFRIERRDDEVIAVPVECSYVSTDVSRFEFEGKLENKADNSVLLSELMEEGDCIGIWIQRGIRKGYECMSNEEILKNYKDKFNYPTVEEVDMIITYDLVPPPENYDADYKKPDYS